MDLKKLTSVAGAFLVGAGIFFSGLFIKSGIDNIAYRDRTVSVRGLAERTVESDYVTWPIQYRVAGNDLISLYDQVTANNAIIVKFLTSNGIAKEDISVNPPDTYNATANQYGSDNFQYKYALDCNVTVATTNVKKVRELLNRQSELLREGIPYSNSYQAADDCRRHQSRTRGRPEIRPRLRLQNRKDEIGHTGAILYR